MGRRVRGLAALLLAATLCLGLSACASGDTLTETNAADYVQGLLRATYHETWDAVYLDLVDLTEAEAQKAYDDGIDQEYARFTYQFSIRDQYLSKGVRAQVQQLLKDVCARTSYAVKSATLLDDGDRYAVEVAVRPYDLFLQVKEDDLTAFQAEFEKEYADTNPNALTADGREAFWKRYEDHWARGVVQLCRDKLGTAAALDVQPILVLVSPDDKGLYKMQDNDFVNLSALILPY